MDNITSERFKDKVVLIIGGTSGIGLATAVEFAANGAQHIVVAGRRESKWLTAQKYITAKLNPELQNRIEYWSCDVRVESQVKGLVEKIFSKYKRLDVCFNNAGVQPGVVTGSDSGFITSMVFESGIAEDGSITYRLPPPQPTSSATYSDDHIEATQQTPASPYCESEIATSCLGVFYCLKWQIHYILAQQPKDLPVSIINTSSRNGILPDAHRPLYAASKAFIIAITKSVANQVAQKTHQDNRAMIRVNAVCPGPIDTPLEFAAYGVPVNNATTEQYSTYSKGATVGVPMRRTGQPEEIAPTILFLADHQTASYITGAAFSVDGGHTGSPLLCPCE
jgi:NAD(P)-dependent dehydrogenase (short-subunit alcohol dehydrogenase family)